MANTNTTSIIVKPDLLVYFLFLDDDSLFMSLIIS